MGQKYVSGAKFPAKKGKSCESSIFVLQRRSSTDSVVIRAELDCRVSSCSDSIIIGLVALSGLGGGGAKRLVLDDNKLTGFWD